MKIIIAGAGASGLAAATWLTKLGHEVEVFEATERAGGRAKIARRPQSDDLFDVGTQYFHSNYKRARSLLRDCGLHKELHMINGPTRFFDKMGQYKADLFRRLADASPSNQPLCRRQL